MKSGKQCVELMRFGSVYRFHTRPVLQRDTVAEHSGRAATLMIALWPQCTMNAVKGMLLHDLAEWFTGDLPAPVKLAKPMVGMLISTLEAEVEHEYGLSPLAPGELYSPEELWWLKWCDWLEGVLYCLREHAMGNRLVDKPFWSWIELLQTHADKYPTQCQKVWVSDDPKMPPRPTEEALETHKALHAILVDMAYYWQCPTEFAHLYR